MEAAWENEQEMREHFPTLFEPSSISLSLLSRKKVLLVVDVVMTLQVIFVYSPSFTMVRDFLQRPQVIYDLLALTFWLPSHSFGFFCSFPCFRGLEA